MHDACPSTLILQAVQYNNQKQDKNLFRVVYVEKKNHYFAIDRVFVLCETSCELTQN